MPEPQEPHAQNSSPDDNFAITNSELPETRPQEQIESFTTSHGSVYTYAADGHTTRFKTAAGEEQPTQDLTVFVDIGAREAGSVALAYLFRSSLGATKIEVVEQQKDGGSRIITDIKDVMWRDALQVATLRNGQVIRSKPASLFPRVGAYVFDSRRFEENGKTRVERHLGHKVTGITHRT